MGRNGTALTRQAFDHLLEALDRDRDAAGEKYEGLRRLLTVFFRVRGLPHPDECADHALSVAATKLAEGEEVQNISAYCLGVARLVAFERYRRQAAEAAAANELAAVASSTPPSEPAQHTQEQFERCLAMLDEPDRRLILGYYGGDEGTRIQTRRTLAKDLGVPMNALRIRAHRIRNRLERAFLERRGSDR